MARDIEMEVSLKPMMDMQALNQTRDKLAKQLSTIQRGNHASLRAMLASWSVGAVKAGQADTTRAAIMQFLGTTQGGQYTTFQRNFARAAGYQGAAILNQEKQAITQAARTHAAERRALVAAFKQTEAERAYDTKQFVSARFRREELADIRRGYKGLRAQHMRLLREGGTEAEWTQHQAETVKLDNRMTRMISNMEKNGKSATKIQKETAQNTKRLATESARGGKIVSQPLSGLGQLGVLGLRALGIGTLVGAVVKAVTWAWRQGKLAEMRGAAAFDRNAAYGYSDRVLGLSEMTAVQYGINPEAVQRAQDYGADFRERMMWGEVSDREWIALSRRGEYGRLLMSGVGETDPERLQRALEAQIRAAGNDPRKLAQLRHDLQALGQDTSLLKLRMHTPTEEEYQRSLQQYTQSTKKDIRDAQEKASLDRGLDPTKRGIGGEIGGWRSIILGQASAQRRIEEQRAMGKSDEEIWAEDRETYNVAKYGYIRGRLKTNWLDKESWSLTEAMNPRVREWLGLGGNNIGTQNITIQQTITSTDPREAGAESARQITDALSSTDQAATSAMASKYFRNIGRPHG